MNNVASGVGIGPTPVSFNRTGVFTGTRRLKLEKKRVVNVRKKDISENILMIEDEMDIRTILKDVLEWEGSSPKPYSY
jgi:hypothetical protein